MLSHSVQLDWSGERAPIVLIEASSTVMDPSFTSGGGRGGGGSSGGGGGGFLRLVLGTLPSGGRKPEASATGDCGRTGDGGPEMHNDGVRHGVVGPLGDFGDRPMPQSCG